jgi:hypothetical protein
VLAGVKAEKFEVPIPSPVGDIPVIKKRNIDMLASSCLECEFKLHVCSNKYPCRRLYCSNKYKCKQEYLICQKCHRAIYDEEDLIEFKRDRNEQLDSRGASLLSFAYGGRSVVDSLDQPIEVGEHYLRNMVSCLELNAQSAPNPQEKEMTDELILFCRHPDFPHIVAVEWFYDANNEMKGKGDLVYSNFYFPPSALNQLLENPAYNELPLKILVVEVKHLSRNNKGYEKVQVMNSMTAWRERRVRDEIWGTTVTQNNNGLACFATIFPLDEIRVNALQMEPVPSSLWAIAKKNQSNRFPRELWEELILFSKAQRNRCNICSAFGDLVLHQKWLRTTVSEAFVLKFLGFELLCHGCHDVKHPGRAYLAGRDILQHLIAVNNWTHDDGENQIKQIFIKWNLENKFRIDQVDVSLFESHEVVLKWKETHPDDRVYFSSYCCKFDQRAPNIC